ncbi:MAG TPA: phosphoribosylaminoimidazolesuccinocarboxamide synthase [Candidatus Limnocylindrales bacterium]|nr:phosphoribosylaminoimidazolesuccinocarboxamide synthase [Candidatus Limnocylindrales bacterium]
MQLADLYLRSGKVRDLFQLPNHRILLVASDRISAFDVVLPNVIPDKGRVLTGLSRFWFAETRGIVRNHLLDTDPAVLGDVVAVELERAGIVHELGPLDELRGRIMICRPAVVLPVEAVVRGYLAGSGWKEYRDRGTVCGIALPPGLREGDRLPEPLFTPATKAPAGEHDQNITFDGLIDHLAEAMPGGERQRAARLAERVRDVSLRLYGYAAAVTARKGLILADTKFEFGQAFSGDDEPFGPFEERIGRRPMGARMEAVGGDPDDSLMLIDEALTPDSSRFWDAATYAPGGPQASFDKQYVRDWLEDQPWDKTAPGPVLPDEVVAGTRRRYVEAYERITGASFARYLEQDVIAPAEPVR